MSSRDSTTGKATQVDIMTDGPVLVLVGDFDVRSTWRVRTALYDHLAACDSAEVVVDLTEVRTADVSALKVLAVASLAAGRRGQSVRLRGCGPSVRRLLHMSRLIRLVEVERVAATA